MRQSPRPRTRLLTIAAALAAATAIAACGSGSPARSVASAGRSAPTTGSASAAASLVAFSRCMRADGVPNFPDLKSGAMELAGAPGRTTVSVNGVPVNAPAFASARQKCERLLPRQSTGSSPAAQTRRGLQFSKCMRSHGVPNFPDPRTVAGHGGNSEVYLPGVNLGSPAVQSAARACGGGPKGP